MSTKFINTFLKILVLFFGALLVLLLIARTPNVSVETLEELYTDSNSQFISVDGHLLGAVVHLQIHGDLRNIHVFDRQRSSCVVGGFTNYFSRWAVPLMLVCQRVAFVQYRRALPSRCWHDDVDWS